ncbi:Coiled-coil domain-containing protein 39-like isoform X2 [Oopsacas minuta]|uniref:Coiled-coil domain-containing protein 39 n=1 Tax=Oopsacas minuta TaxID=111878 RepID=A0AAV7JGC7_9METZ|nr:Coiled-coil domain-containing protein 39-like isoform X2 [Oopsacas minuta]
MDLSRITELGLGIGLEGGVGALPVASEENKQLRAEVLEQSRELSTLRRDTRTQKDRGRLLQEHLALIRQELQHTQGLLTARERVKEGEQHMRLLAEREISRLSGDHKRIEGEYSSINERLAQLESAVYKDKSKLQQISEEINWDQQTRNEWLKKQSKEEDDVITIEKYSRQDEARIKTLSLEMEKLEGECRASRKQLEDEVTDTISNQIALDKVAEEYRDTHKEREELLKQWEAILDQMKRRDGSIELTAKELESVKTTISEQENALDQKKQFLLNEEGNNEELEKKHNITERLVAKQRLEYNEAESSRLQFRDELETLKYTVDRTAADLETLRGECNHLNRNGKEQTQKLTEMQGTVVALREQLSKSTYSTLSSEERAQKLESILKQEENEIMESNRKSDLLRDKEFKIIQQVQEVKEKEATMLGEEQGYRAAHRNLTSNLQKLDKQSLQQQELIYTQDYQIVQLEKRLGRLEGETSAEEKKALQDKITELNERKDYEDKQELLLTNQLKRLEDELRRVGREDSKNREEEADLQGKIDEVTLYLDSTQRLIKKVTREKQESMVDRNLLKLQVRKLRDSLFTRADEVYSLEKRKLELITAMTERSKEIDLFKEMIEAQIRSSANDKQKVNFELHQRLAQIDKLQKRYEIVSLSLAPPEGEEVHSQAYYVIKAAQEREELQREGDELDAKIRKAEREIRALENTLGLIFDRNESFRKSLLRADNKSELSNERSILEKQLNSTLDKSRFKERQKRELLGDLGHMENRLRDMLSDEHSVANVIEKKRISVEQTNKSITEQKEKVDRSLKQLTKAYRELKGKCDANKVSNIEKDIALRDLRDLNVASVQEMVQVSEKDLSMLDSLHTIFSQVGLPTVQSTLTSRPGSQVSLGSSRHTSRVPSCVPSAVSSAVTMGEKETGQVVATKTVEIGLDLPSEPGSRKSSADSYKRSAQSSRVPSVASSRASSSRKSQTKIEIILS